MMTKNPEDIATEDLAISSVAISSVAILGVRRYHDPDHEHHPGDDYDNFDYGDKTDFKLMVAQQSGKGPNLKVVKWW